jgi:hypothetical protein
MSLIVTSLLVASGVIAGRWIAKRARRGDEDVDDDHDRDDRDDDDEHKKDDAAKKRPTGPAANATPAVDAFATFPCRLGDVVIGIGGDEAWLAGALVFYEESPAIALFIAPDAGGDRAVLARPRPTEELQWLKPVASGAIDVGKEPPSTIEHAGERFERLRRLPLRAERHGTGAPDVGDDVILAEYKSLGGDRLVVVVGAAGPRVWQGTLLEPAMFEVLASGASTLENG